MVCLHQNGTRKISFHKDRYKFLNEYRAMRASQRAQLGAVGTGEQSLLCSSNIWFFWGQSGSREQRRVLRRVLPLDPNPWILKRVKWVLIFSKWSSRKKLCWCLSKLSFGQKNASKMRPLGSLQFRWGWKGATLCSAWFRAKSVPGFGAQMGLIYA